MGEVVKFERRDGVYSYFSNIGTSKDKGNSLRYAMDAPMFQTERDNLYDGEITRTIIDTIVDDSLRPWIDVNHDKSNEILFELNRLEASTHISFAAKMERKDDGALVFMDINDGLDPIEPVDYKRVQGIKSLQCWERWYCFPVAMGRAMNPTHYKIMQDGKEMIVHVSRLLVFPGDPVSYDARVRNNGWGGSVMKRIKKTLLGYLAGNATLPTIIQEFIVDILKYKGLNDMSENSGSAAEMDEQAFKAKTEFMMMAKSLINAVVIDSEDELVSNTKNVSGLKDLMTQLCYALCASAQMPFGKMFKYYLGNSMSTSSESEQSDWEQQCTAYQHDKLTPQLTKLIMVIGAGFKVLEPIPFKWLPITEPTLKEMADAMRIMAQADVIYNKLGLPGWKIIESRFSGPEFSIQTTVDAALINEMKKPTVPALPPPTQASQTTAKFAFDYDPYA